MQPDNACPGEAGGGRSAVQFADDGGGEERLDGTTSGEAAESGRVVPKRDSSRYVSAMFSDYHRAELARRMTRLGAVDTGISLEVFRQLWLAVMPQRTGWSETEQTFDEIDVDGSGFIEFEELLVYLETWSRKRADEATIVHPSSCKQWSWLFVGTAQEAVAVDREGNTRVLVTVALPIYRVFSQFMVLVSVGIIMAESMPELQKQDGESGNDTTFAIETVCILFFSLELLVYTWSYPGPWYKWLRDKATWVDVISIAPYYVRLVWTTSTSGVQEASAVRVTRMVRLLRALRALRVLRLTSGSGRVSKVPQLLRVLRESAVPLFWLLILIFIITVLSASIIFFIEKEEAEFRMKEQRWFRDNTSSYKDAGEPTHFQSIPEVMWWTLAAVSAGEQGYDEYAPATRGPLLPRCSLGDERRAVRRRAGDAVVPSGNLPAHLHRHGRLPENAPEGSAGRGAARPLLRLLQRVDTLAGAARGAATPAGSAEEGGVAAAPGDESGGWDDADVHD
eukprot:TRINITY_DN2072_c0_g1_i3.p1 TRINITY_DN2072_c0_g1~~TRINITY_DN2072_c0_g1_i3.p1  ORF type:complete len:524 (+),score=127.52 TRINITY_DN2072_c0_g1_i3:51-1574(+)